MTTTPPSRAPASPLRDRSSPDHARVHFAELFFDLVFVFAITQLSHSLLEHPSLEGALQTGFLMIAVWVVWIYTTWAANWFNPRAASVRLMLFALMAAGLVVSVSIPEAFGERGIYFGIAFALMQNGRNLVLLWALRRGEPNHLTNFTRIQAWIALSGALWIAGGIVEGDVRWAFWGAALLIELGSPWWGFWVPGMGRSTTADWSIDPGHMAERCGLFVILALGESVLILGATFASHEWTWATKAAFATGFVGSVAMWWIYFATTAEAADAAFHHHRDPGRIARAGYTNAHIPLIAGIIVTAVSDELVLGRPEGHVDDMTLACTLGGPALFLIGSALFNRIVRRVLPMSHGVGVALLAGCLLIAPQVSPLLLSALTSGILVLVGAWETIAPANRSRAAQLSHAE